MTDYHWSLSVKGNYNPNQPRIPEGQPGGGRWSSGSYAPAWATNIRTWMEGGTRVPPEMYDGLDSDRGGKIHVRQNKNGTYDVIHDYGEMKNYWARNANWDLAHGMAERLYGRILNNEHGDLIGQHRKLVKAALKRGDEVPQDVLRDYPDLVKD